MTEVHTFMNAVSNIPLPGLAPELPLRPATVVAESELGRALRKLKDILVSIYAYGLLLFGLTFPIVLAVWHAFFGPATP